MIPMISRLVIKTAFAASVLTAILSASQAHAQTLYSTGFEAPAFSTTTTGTFPNFYTGVPFTTVPGAVSTSNTDVWGNIWERTTGNNVQNAINYENSLNSATVQAGVVRSGEQALKVDGIAADQDEFAAFKELYLSTSEGIYDISFDMRVSGADVLAGQWGLTLIDLNGNSVAGLGFYDGILVAGSGTTIYGLGPVTPIGYDNWANYKLRVNFTARTISVALNGLPISSLQNLPMTTEFIYTAQTAGFGLGGQTPNGAPYFITPEHAYFDNVSVAAAAPEPGTLGLLVLGGTLVVVRRARSRRNGR
jgi:hypothetical protein